jgi:HSP20 family protein
MFGLTPWKEREKVSHPMSALRDEFKALYDRFFGGWPTVFAGYPEVPRFWGLEVNETEQEVVVRAELPGFAAEEVEVELREGALMIRAEKKPKEVEKEPHEFAEYRYERLIELPAAVAPEKAEAQYRNGVLEVHLPKTEEARTRRIPVK